MAHLSESEIQDGQILPVSGRNYHEPTDGISSEHNVE